MLMYSGFEKVVEETRSVPERCQSNDVAKGGCGCSDWGWRGMGRNSKHE